MSDATDTNANQNQVSENPESAQVDSKPDYMTNKDFNLAINKRFKDFESKVLAAVKPAEKQNESKPKESIYEEKLAAMEARYQKGRAATKANTLKAELSARGVKPELLDMVAHYHGQNVHFADDDSDELVFRDASGDVSLSTALDALIKSEKGKHYLAAPKPIQGSGDTNKQSSNSNLKREQEIERQKAFFLGRGE